MFLLRIGQVEFSFVKHFAYILYKEEIYYFIIYYNNCISLHIVIYMQITTYRDRYEQIRDILNRLN